MFSLEGAPGADRAGDRRRHLRGASASRDGAPDRRRGARARARQRGRRGGRRSGRRALRRDPRGRRHRAGVRGQLRAATDVELRNVLLTLPGEPRARSCRRRARLRDRPGGRLERRRDRDPDRARERARGRRPRQDLRARLDQRRRAGRRGSPELLESLPERDSVEAVIVISQPGAAEPRAAVRGRQLDRRHQRAGAARAHAPSWRRDPGSGCARARPRRSPSSRGWRSRRGSAPQAPLIADGVDAIAISSAGERPLPAPADDDSRTSRSETLDAFGRAIQSTVGAVDAARHQLDHGPDAHLELADNLVPAGRWRCSRWRCCCRPQSAAVDACARAARAAGRRSDRACLGRGARAAVASARSRRSTPSRSSARSRGRRSRSTPALYELGGRRRDHARAGRRRRDRQRGAAAVARGLAARRPPACRGARGSARSRSVACLVIWLANPYLALLLAPVAHVWLLAPWAPGAGRERSRWRLPRSLACAPGARRAGRGRRGARARRRRTLDVHADGRRRPDRLRDRRSAAAFSGRLAGRWRDASRSVPPADQIPGRALGGAPQAGAG